MFLHQLLFTTVFLTLFIQFSRAQSTCTFSCPTTDTVGQALLKHALAVPNKSDYDYSIFECVYGEVNENPKVHSCFYNKVDGKHALGSEKDGCPGEAIPCSSDDDSSSHFSSPGHPEVPAWIENGRYLLYLKENHI